MPASKPSDLIWVVRVLLSSSTSPLAFQHLEIVDGNAVKVGGWDGYLWVLVGVEHLTVLIMKSNDPHFHAISKTKNRLSNTRGRMMSRGGGAESLIDPSNSAVLADSEKGNF